MRTTTSLSIVNHGCSTTTSPLLRRHHHHHTRALLPRCKNVSLAVAVALLLLWSACCGRGRSADRHLPHERTCVPLTFSCVVPPPLLCCRDFEGGAVIKEASLFRTVITHALQQLHGQVGAALDVDVTKLDPRTGEAVLRVHAAGMTRLQSALTMLGEYDRRRCQCTVLKTTPFLTGVAVDSRAWVP
jgi:hypothetical protein